MGANTETCLTLPNDAYATTVAASVKIPTPRPAGHDTAGCADAKPRGPIKALLFDVADVLFEGTAWYRWLARILARLEPPLSESEFARPWQSDYLPRVYRGEQEFFEAFATCLTSCGLSAATVEEIVAAGRAERRRQNSTLRPLPGVRATLSRLKAAGIPLAVLTNLDRTGSALAADLSRLRLDGLFCCLITSQDLRMCLPEACCYARALDSLQVAASESLFVSHDASQLVGAQAAGFAAATLSAPCTIPGVTHLERFDRLLDMVLPEGASYSRAPQFA